MIRMAKTIIHIAASCIVACMALPSFGGILTFDENVIPTNPENGFGSFTFDDFSAPGAVTTTATSIVLDIVDGNASNGVFGGVGVDFLQRDFDPALTDLEIRLQVLPDNEATEIRIAYRDLDGGGAADEHIFSFDISSLTPLDGFVTLSQNMAIPLFTQGAFGFAAGDGTQNPELDQFQIQSVFASQGRLNVEIDYVQIVPEPSTLLAGSLLGAATLLRRKA